MPLMALGGKKKTTVQIWIKFQYLLQEKKWQSDHMYLTYVLETPTCIPSRAIYIYIYIQEVLIQESDPQLPPPHLHTSDRPIFKIPFDSENSGKLTRFRIAWFLIVACFPPFPPFPFGGPNLGLNHNLKSM